MPADKCAATQIGSGKSTIARDAIGLRNIIVTVSTQKLDREGGIFHAGNLDEGVITLHRSWPLPQLRHVVTIEQA
jgi:hypothetical protein